MAVPKKFKFKKVKKKSLKLKKNYYMSIKFFKKSDIMVDSMLKIFYKSICDDDDEDDADDDDKY